MERTFSVKRVIQGRFQKGDDLYDSLLDVIRKNNIEAGLITGVGALSRASLACFNQQAGEYLERRFDEEMEILGMQGNISLKDGAPFAHVHVTLGRNDFSAIGGHLLPGTVVYACEFEIIETEGRPFKRVFDGATKLFLWELRSEEP